MRIYFVRHGSTDSLEKRICQPDKEPLNQKGIEQAKALGKRFLETRLDSIISSPHARALQTARAISSDIIVSSLFAEAKKPKEVVGKSKDDEKIKNILKKISEMYISDPTWHYSDEENFEDLKKRGFKALDFLVSQKGEKTLVVSHGNFIALMVGLMMFGEKYTVDISLRLKNFLRIGSTGVSIFSYQEGEWIMECWNDTSHRLE
jgi:uncharacterized phosphatase